MAAWGPIVARWPHARLWLAGDGPDRAALQGQIAAMNLGHRVMLVGVFDTIDELLYNALATRAGGETIDSGQEQ